MTLIASTAYEFKYTQIKKSYPPSTYPDLVPLTTNTYLRPLSGRFLTLSSSTYRLSVAGDTQISGYTGAVNDNNSTGTGSVAGDAVELIDDLKAIFEVPVYGATLTAANLLTYIGTSKDLIVSGSTTTTVQKVNLSAASTQVVKIVGGNVTRQTVYVRINPTKFYAA